MSARHPGLKRLYELDCRRVPTDLRVPEEALRPLRTSGQAADLFKAVVDRRGQESLVVAYLDARHKPIAFQEVARGGLNVVHVAPRDVYAPAVALGSPAILYAHNHPSGDATPSDDDVALTDRIRAAGRVLGIEPLDHLIVSDTDFYSFSDGRLHKEKWQPGVSYSTGGWGSALAAAAGVGALVLGAFTIRRLLRGGDRDQTEQLVGFDVLGARVIA